MHVVGVIFVMLFIVFVFVVIGVTIFGFAVTRGVRRVRRFFTGAAPAAPGRITFTRFSGTGTVRCIDPRCLAENPPQAQFCRRCGSSLAARSVRGRTPMFRRAALW